MSTRLKNYVDEAKRLVDIIDETKIKSQKDFLFFRSMKEHVRVAAFIGERQIFWLRDIKDRQLERESSFKEYNDKEDDYRD